MIKTLVLFQHYLVCPTYNCTATRSLILSYGVYDGLRQPLALFTAHIRLILAKTA